MMFRSELKAGMLLQIRENYIFGHRYVDRWIHRYNLQLPSDAEGFVSHGDFPLFPLQCDSYCLLEVLSD